MPVSSSACASGSALGIVRYRLRRLARRAVGVVAWGTAREFTARTSLGPRASYETKTMITPTGCASG